MVVVPQPLGYLELSFPYLSTYIARGHEYTLNILPFYPSTFGGCHDPSAPKNEFDDQICYGREDVKGIIRPTYIASFPGLLCFLDHVCHHEPPGEAGEGHVRGQENGVCVWYV